MFAERSAENVLKRTNRALVIVIFSFASAGQLLAQQTPVLSHYYYNPYLINPALTGQSKETRAFFIYRHQWIGIPGSPETQSLTIDGPLADKRIGLGLNLNNDVSNIIGRFTGMVSASYALNLATDHELSFGMSLGILRNEVKFDQVRGDVTDPGLLQNAENRTTLEGNAGLSYRFKKLRAGFVSEQLFNRKLTYQNPADFREVSFLMVRHYLISLQYDFALNQNWQLTPLVVLRSAQGLPAQVDINAMLNYRGIAWTNIAYRHESGVAMAIGAKISNQFVISYNYEMPTSDLRYTTGGSHEVMLGMRFWNRGSDKTASAPRTTAKGMEELKRDTRAQYERLDELQQKNETLNRELAEYKKVIEQQNSEIEQLKKSISSVDEELKATIDQVKVDLQKEESFDKAFTYYLVIGAVKTFEDAKAFQKIIKRETKLDPEIIQNESQTWYFIYSEELQSPGEARRKLRELENENIKPLIIGNPWVYKTKAK